MWQLLSICRIDTVQILAIRHNIGIPLPSVMVFIWCFNAEPEHAQIIYSHNTKLYKGEEEKKEKEKKQTFPGAQTLRRALKMSSMHHQYLHMVMLYSKTCYKKTKHFSFTALCVALPLAFIQQFVFTTLGWVIILFYDKQNSSPKI